MQVPSGCLACELVTTAGSRLVDLVVHVRDVVDEGHVVSTPTQPVAEPGEDDEGPRVPDVRALVNGRAADVHPDRPRRRRELDERAREAVVDAHGGDRIRVVSDTVFRQEISAPIKRRSIHTRNPVANKG